MRNKLKTDKYMIVKVKKAIILYGSFPQVWVFFALLFIAILSVLISMWLNDLFWSGIFSNIFAGLVTGLAIALLSGSKQLYIAHLESRYKWLEMLRKMLLDFFKARQQILDGKGKIDSWDEFIYDIGCHANWVNDTIISGSANESIGFDTVKYCKKHFGYDAKEMEDVFNELHIGLLFQDYGDTICGALDFFDPTYRKFVELDHNICSKLRELDIKIHAVERSIL